MAEAAAATAATTDATAAATAADPWHKGVESEYLGHWQNKAWKYDDPKTIAIEATKAALAAQKIIGVPPEQIVRLPSKPDDEAGWKGVWTRLGVPGEAKDYDLSSVKFADGSDLPEGLTATIRDASLAARVPKEHGATIAKAVVKHLDGARAETAAADAAKLAVERANLAKSWGQNADFNKRTAMEGARRLGIDHEGVAALEKVVGYAKVMEAMRRVGASSSEDTWKGGDTQPGGAMTREAATARKKELMADTEWGKRYMNGGAVEKREMTNLNMLISGDVRAA